MSPALRLLRAVCKRLLPKSDAAVDVHGGPLRAWLAAQVAARDPVNRSGNNASVR